MNEIIITNTNGQLTTSSLGVAETFGKQHKDVIKSIENLHKETLAKNFANLTAENSALTNMFIESTYLDSYGRCQKCYEITRDGFSLLVMGFTGRKALEWKLKYIEAFNLMEQKLRNGSAVNIEELITKAVTSAVAETVKVLIPFMQSPAQSISITSDSEPKRIRKKYRHTTPSKISMLEPELKKKVDDMIISDEYSCQQIANFIMNNSDTEISQMAVNRYKRINFI